MGIKKQYLDEVDLGDSITVLVARQKINAASAGDFSVVMRFA
jgi:hypothetical protein